MLKQSLTIASATGVSQVIAALLYIVMARIAGPGSLGEVVAAVAAATFLAGLFHFGTNGLWARDIANSKMQPEIFAQKATSKVILSTAPCILLSILAITLFPDTKYYAVGFLTATILLSQTFQVPLRAIGASRRLAVALLLEKTVAAAIFVLLLVLHVDPANALIMSLGLGFTVSALIASALSPASFKIRNSKHRLVWPWKGATSFGMGGIVIAAQSLDVNILHAVAGSVSTGIYGAVNRWTQPLSLVASAVAITGLPVVAKTRSLRKSFRTLKNSYLLLGCAAAMSLFVAVFSTSIVRILLGEQYAESAPVLTILALGTIPALINQPLYVFMQALNYQRAVAVILAVVVTIQLIGCAVLGYYYKELGASIAYAVAQTLTLAGFSLFLLLRCKGPKYYKRAVQSFRSGSQLARLP